MFIKYFKYKINYFRHDLISPHPKGIFALKITRFINIMRLATIFDVESDIVVEIFNFERNKKILTFFWGI